MSLAAQLKLRYPSELVEALIAAYREIEENFFLGKWKASELDAGHFVEVVRRVIEQELFASYTPINKQLAQFSDAELKRFENHPGDESFRMLIPRALKAVYNVRNKRGVGHLGAISPNEMDATYILYTVKWVLAELVRIASGSDPAAAQKAIASIVERRVGALWKNGDTTRVLATGLTAKEQVLILLFDSSPRSEEQLLVITEYKNASKFRSILRNLHDHRLVEYEKGGPVLITSKGVIAAELVLKKLGAVH